MNRYFSKSLHNGFQEQKPGKSEKEVAVEETR